MTEGSRIKGEWRPMAAPSFDFAPGLPPPAVRWNGRVKFDFTGGNNDPDRVPVDGLIAAAESVLKREGRMLAIYGVNQGPQSVARMNTTRAVSTNLDSGVIYVSRIRYDVIRPCGPFQGINMLQSIGIQQTNQVPNVSWFGTASLQAAIAANGPYTKILSVTNVITNSYTPPVIQPSQFFRLQYPPYPFF